MASNAPPSVVSRYRPAVLVLTGLAAAYGTYLIYSSLTSSTELAPGPGQLRRSNALHRSRRRPVVKTYYDPEYVDRDGDPIGHVTCEYGQYKFHYPIRLGTPRHDYIVTTLRCSSDEAERAAADIELIAISVMLHALEDIGTRLLDQFPLGDQIDYHTIYDPFVRAVRARDYDGLISNIDVLTVRGIWQYREPAAREAIARYCARQSIESVYVQTMGDSTSFGVPGVDETETLANASNPDENREPGQGIKGLLYHIAEEEAKRKAYVHRGTTCDSCNAYPIRGVRWHCINCPDFDLCSTCEAQGVHPKTHVFAKVKIPIPALCQPHQIHLPWYPGNPDQVIGPLNASTIRLLVQQTGLEDMQIESFYEQFSCLVNARMLNDRLDIDAAIDRNAFNKAMTAETWPYPLQTNLLYDRMFDFYDISKDGLIDFWEFVHGMAYMTQPARRGSMDRIFRGYDLDGDGYVSRSDFVRMLSAKYAVHKTIIMDNIKWEHTNSRYLQDDRAQIVHTSQPLSSAFDDMDIPEGETRRPRNKPVDQYGESQVGGGGLFARTILPNGESEMDLSFWNAVFDRYGRPNRLTDLHPNFNESLEGRAEARARYTGSEMLRVGGDGVADDDRFLVATDTRARRGPGFNAESLDSQWTQDLDDARTRLASATTGDFPRPLSSDAQPVINFASRGAAYEIPAEEKDFGSEVLFQVVQEGFNEMLDPLFKPKEKLAAEVLATKAERERFRSYLEEHKKKRAGFRDELAAGSKSDPLLATALSSYTTTTALQNGDQPAGRSTEYPFASSSAPSRNTQQVSETPSQEPASSVFVPQPQAQGRSRTPTTEEQAEISQIIQRNLVPVDDTSLEDMESSIRQQPLDELLASAGYSVASPSEEVAPAVIIDPSVGTVYGTVSESSMYSEMDSAAEAVTEPTLPQNRSTAESAPHERAATIPMRLSPSLPQTPSPAEPLRELPETPLSHSFNALTPPVNGSTRVSVINEPERSMLTEETDDSLLDASATDASPMKNSSESSERPSEERLEYLVRLEAEEAEIIARGGPARLDLKELEAIVLKDEREKGGPVLRGLVESWLEWAAF